MKLDQNHVQLRISVNVVAPLGCATGILVTLV
jgi:hypothetical protein